MRKKDPAVNQDDALFVSLRNSKKRRKRRILITTLSILAAVLIALLIGVLYLRNQVDSTFNDANADVLTATAAIGNVSTTVSGDGTLEDVDLEELTVPADVTVDEILVEAQAAVAKGDIIARVDLSSVLAAMSSAQAQLDAYDDQLAAASDDAVKTSITAGISGRVKAVYCQAGDTVAQCMYDHGALLLLSADGYMAAELEAGTLRAGDSLTAKLQDGTETDAFVDCITAGTATILLNDEIPAEGDTVTFVDANGSEYIASLSIHNPLRITGFAGTVDSCKVDVGDKVSASTSVLTLSDTAYSANYDAILRQREETEETLMQLLTIYHDGALLSPISGSVSSVTDLDSTDLTADPTADQLIAVISPDQQMKLTISVDEASILSLEPDQSVEVTVDSIGEDSFEGRVSTVNKTASTDSGVTSYSAEILLDKQEKMLSGMSAKAVIRIEGVDNAIVIPADALHQTSSTSYVYTSYDAEKGEYGGMVEVTTGLIGTNEVEITAGLKEGDVVYYTEHTSSNNGWGGFGGSGGMSGRWGSTSGGNQPSSGFEMPSGGMNSFPGGGTKPSGGAPSARGN